MGHMEISENLTKWPLPAVDASYDSEDSTPFSFRRSLSYYFSPRHDVVNLMPKDADSVLEVGCGGGATGQLLKRMGVRYRYGVEINSQLAEIARERYTEVIVSDAETMNWDWAPKEGLDCILFPDILEHLRDPWSFLKFSSQFLKPGGYVVASVPNVRYYKAVIDLVWSGAWSYQEAGILDFGHLRFFTLNSALELVESAGLSVRRVHRNKRGSNILKLANTIGMGIFREFLVKQYLILAQKKGEN